MTNWLSGRTEQTTYSKIEYLFSNYIYLFSIIMCICCIPVCLMGFGLYSRKDTGTWIFLVLL